MASESGFSNQKKIGKAQYKTIHNLGSDRYGTSVSTKALSELSTVPLDITAVATEIIDGVTLVYLEIVAHGMREGDVVRIMSGALTGYEYDVIEVVDVDTVAVLNIAEPEVGDTIKPMRWVTSKSDAEGNLNFSPGPTQFVKDAATVQVLEDTVDPTNNRPLPTGLYYFKDGVVIPVRRDTVTPSNNAPLPVELIGFDGGTINITAGDINVQLSDMGATFDATRIGDGSGIYLKINADGSINVVDSAVATKLDTLIAKDFATETTLAAVQTLLTSLEGKDFATETTLAALAGEDFATEATLADVKTAVELLAEAVGQDGNPAPAKAFVFGGVDENGDVQLAKVNTAGGLLVSFGAAGFATETTLSSLNNKVANNYGSAAGAVRTASQIGNAGGAADFNSGADSAQTLRVSANLKRSGNELSYNSGAADANTLRVELATGSKVDVSGLATHAKQDELSAKFGTLGQKDSAGSAPVVLSTEQQVILSDILNQVTGLNNPLTPSYQEDLAVQDSETSFTAPAGAKWLKVMADSDNSDAIRIKLGGLASTTSGMKLEPGRSEDFQVAGDLSYCAVAFTGTNKLFVIYGA